MKSSSQKSYFLFGFCVALIPFGANAQSSLLPNWYPNAGELDVTFGFYRSHIDFNLVNDSGWSEVDQNGWTAGLDYGLNDQLTIGVRLDGTYDGKVTFRDPYYSPSPRLATGTSNPTFGITYRLQDDEVPVSFMASVKPKTSSAGIRSTPTVLGFGARDGIKLNDKNWLTYGVNIYLTEKTEWVRNHEKSIGLSFGWSHVITQKVVAKTLLMVTKKSTTQYVYSDSNEVYKTNPSLNISIAYKIDPKSEVVLTYNYETFKSTTYGWMSTLDCSSSCVEISRPTISPTSQTLKMIGLNWLSRF